MHCQCNGRAKSCAIQLLSDIPAESRVEDLGGSVNIRQIGDTRLATGLKELPPATARLHSPHGRRDALVLCYSLDLESTVTLEKGVRNQKCKAPEGPCRLLVPDPFFGPTPKLSCNKALGQRIVGTEKLSLSISRGQVATNRRR